MLSKDSVILITDLKWVGYKTHFWLWAINGFSNYFLVFFIVIWYFKFM